MSNQAEQIANYRLSEYAAALVRDTPLLLIAGVVGGGKNTLINEILKEKDRFLPIVSHTTRPPRENHGVKELDGIDYHFIDAKAASAMIEQQAFIEVKSVHGNIYGTSVAELQKAHDAHMVAITDVDIQGVVEYLAIKPDTHAIFLLPPSIETWLERLGRRYGDLSQHTEEIDKRFQTASREIMHIKQDRRFILVINDDLTTTVERITQIVQGKKSKTSDYALSVADHLLEYIDQRSSNAL